MLTNMRMTAALAAAILSAPALGKTDLAGCTSTQVVSNGGASMLYYVPGTGEVCEFLDCGGGRAAPKTTIPGCPGYVGTATYSPSFITATPGSAAAVANAAKATPAVEQGYGEAPAAEKAYGQASQAVKAATSKVASVVQAATGSPTVELDSPEPTPTEECDEEEDDEDDDDDDEGDDDDDDEVDEDGSYPVKAGEFAAPAATTMAPVPGMQNGAVAKAIKAASASMSHGGAMMSESASAYMGAAKGTAQGTHAAAAAATQTKDAVAPTRSSNSTTDRTAVQAGAGAVTVASFGLVAGLMVGVAALL